MIPWKNVYLIGIGGIGMSAIARYFKFKGLNVSGYDRTASDLTRKLEAEGIEVHYEDDSSRIPDDVEGTLVIYTPAIPPQFGELVYAQEKAYKLVKRSRALGEICCGHTCLAVAGTHGKTTTSTLVAHILTESGKGCNAFLGGISKNYGTNLLVSDNATIVAEADEFDRSFLQLTPSIAAITAMDADHLDIYGDLKHVREAFAQFAGQVRDTLILKHGLTLDSVNPDIRIFTYSFDNTDANFYADNLRLEPDGHYIFDLVHPAGRISDIRTGTLGWVNVENAVAAAAVCLCYGIDGQKIRQAIGSYAGVSRRLDEHVNVPGMTYLDDYAHHPAELSSTISSIRGIFPGRRITGIFQPHLYTRTRDFAPEFAKALSALDKVILLDIYPAREEPIPGVSSEIIFRDITAAEKVLITKDELMPMLENENVDVLVTFGAGNIDRLVQPITEMLLKRNAS